MSSEPDIDYRPAAQEAALNDEQLRLVERLVGIEHPNVDAFAFGIGMIAACNKIRDNRLTLNDVEELLDQRQLVETAIREGFRGVTRQGGTSWTEAGVFDDGGTEEQRIAAKASDEDQSWEELVENPNWNDNYTAAWCFLDAIGFRYYLAPAMIRDMRVGSLCTLEFALDHPIYEKELRALLSSTQFAALDSFLRYMIAIDERVWSGSQKDLRYLYQKWGGLASAD